MTKQWQCTVCGYIHEGDAPPVNCPVCGADRSLFVLLEAEQTVAETAPALQLHLHPILVHFPNGLMPVVWLFLFMDWGFNRSALAEGAFWMVGVVTLAAPLALASGIYDWKTRFGGEKAPIFYRKIALASVLIILGSLALPIHLYGGAGMQVFYYLCLTGMLGCVGLLGFYGGKLAFSRPSRQ
jgi:rubredoxin